MSTSIGARLVAEEATFGVSGAGHSNNLHLNAADWFDRANE
ncbi:hypothetical protein [Hyphococcus sp.]